MSNVIYSLSDEELNVNAGADISATMKDITVVLDSGEDAAGLPGKLSLPLGLKLDDYSNGIMLNEIAPAMGTTGPRTLYATFTISYPYVHVTGYTLS